MLRICKTPILGYEANEVIHYGVNYNYRTVMGYDQETKTIHARVEKVVKPDLTRDENVEVSYVTVDEREFTEKDFLKPTDNMMWVVDFDVESEKIKDPLDVLEYTKQFAAYDENAHLNVYMYIDKRFSSNTLLPLFAIEDFYKQTTGFATAIITYYVNDTTIISPTTWTQQDEVPKTVVKEVSFREKNSWNATMRTNVFFEILNQDGSVNADVDVTPTLDIRTDYYDNSVDSPAQAVANILGNQFEVTLPKSDLYKVRVNYFNMVKNKDLSVRFDVRCINGISSKDRLNSGIKAGQTAPDYTPISAAVEQFINSIDTHLEGNTEGFMNFDYTKFAGYDTLSISNLLEAGDSIRLKLDCGGQSSYAELVIHLV